jgi:hypothetical protein
MLNNSGDGGGRFPGQQGQFPAGGAGGGGGGGPFGGLGGELRAGVGGPQGGLAACPPHAMLA